jgi:hypothetical protein
MGRLIDLHAAWSLHNALPCCEPGSTQKVAGIFGLARRRHPATTTRTKRGWVSLVRRHTIVSPNRPPFSLFPVLSRYNHSREMILCTLVWILYWVDEVLFAGFGFLALIPGEKLSPKNKSINWSKISDPIHINIFLYLAMLLSYLIPPCFNGYSWGLTSYPPKKNI